MDDPSNRTARSGPRAGGALITLATLLGTGFGIAYRQPSLGLVIGLGIGVAAAIAVWLVDRRRTP